MIFSFIASLFIVQASAQDTNSLEAELESLPVPVTTSKKRTVKRKTAVPPIAAATPKKLPYAFTPFPFLRVRFAESNRDFGIFTTDLGLNAPAQFYFYSKTNLRSTAASKTRTDFLSYNSANYLISPQIYGFGVVGVWTNSTTPNSAATRGGPYYRILERFGSHSALFVIAHAVGDFLDESSRTFFLCNLSFFDNLIGMNGNYASSKLQGVWSAGFDADLTIKLYEGLRFAMGYAMSRKVGAPDTDYAILGLELKAQF